METPTSGYKTLERPTTILLPRLKKDGTLPTINESRSPLLKRLSEEDLLSPDSHQIVHTWLLDQPEAHRRVQFAREENNKHAQEMQSPRRPADSTSKLPDIDQRVRSLDATSFPSIQSEMKNDDVPSKTRDAHLASTTEAKFYRTTSHRAFSISSTSSSTLTRIRQAAFAPSPPPTFCQRAPSEGLARSYVSTSTVRDRPVHLSSLELSPTLSESDRKRFDDIRQHVPDEFEQLLPTLLKLGVINWPKRLFDGNGQLTVTERRQRQRLLAVIDKDEADTERQRYLQRLYGNILPSDDILHKHHLLRENLSSQGQLSLLSAYRDAIESELEKHVPYWKSIPMRGIRTSFTEETHSVHRSSILSTTLHAKQKFLRNAKAPSQISQPTNDDSSLLSVPEEMDHQWQKKSAVKVIERGMTVLDEARKLAATDELIAAEDFELKAQHCVRTFKRWVFLWSTLFAEDKDSL